MQNVLIIFTCVKIYRRKIFSLYNFVNKRMKLQASFIKQFLA